MRGGWLRRIPSRLTATRYFPRAQQLLRFQDPYQSATSDGLLSTNRPADGQKKRPEQSERGRHRIRPTFPAAAAAARCSPVERRTNASRRRPFTDYLLHGRPLRPFAFWVTRQRCGVQPCDPVHTLAVGRLPGRMLRESTRRCHPPSSLTVWSHCSTTQGSESSASSSSSSRESGQHLAARKPTNVAFISPDAENRTSAALKRPVPIRQHLFPLFFFSKSCESRATGFTPVLTSTEAADR
jgi:hypothetical protein